MLSHAVPSLDCAPAPSPKATQRRGRVFSRAEGLSGGSISFELHPPLRRQGADFDPGLVPSGSGEGRVRRRLRLSLIGRPGARLRRQCADRRDRFAASNDAPLFTGPRRLRNGASGHERGLAPGRGGPGLLRGAAQDGAGARLRGGVRGAGAQIPDLGADALPNASRPGAGARPVLARGARRSGAARRAGMSAAPAAAGHVPVLLEEAMEALEPRAAGVYVDGTFGGGGYTRALLARGARVIALDRDPSAIRGGEAPRRRRGGWRRARHRRFVDAARRGGARLLTAFRRAS